ncbi:DEP domain-containing protein 1B-like [Paramacrobiotus metropolitanus]|uniref:DEP domain-containing protein 1B-like n=1 Tax=Paramacrobiotus metropolitanus TaxID=2943436 RepID=UPI0024461244|nr:DEP domain-containing protein 1B-like [Paramacrobiotus metropolitanus]
MEKIELGAPFRATRLWNMVANAFTRQMPVRKHWSRLQKYEECFTGSEAVEWMHAYLKNNPNFGEKCTRAVAVKMLQKLLAHEAFQPVRPSGKDSHSLKFKEDSQLYKFPASLTSENGVKSVRPFSLSNGQSKSLSCDYTTHPTESAKLTAEDIWTDEFYAHLTKLLQLDIEATICPFADRALEIQNVMSNVTQQRWPEISSVVPEFVLMAMKGLEKWPNTPKGVPNSLGFERSLMHVVEAFLRGNCCPLVDGATADLLKQCFELLLPTIPKRHSISIDTSSSVESFMMEILNHRDALNGTNQAESVVYETEFSGTVPETRLVRKRPRSNSLFPSLDSTSCGGPSKPSSSSRSGSSECVMPVSASVSSTGSSPIMPKITRHSIDLSMRPVGSSLEKLNPGYRDESFDDLDEQFYTPLGKVCGAAGNGCSDWDDLLLTSPCPKLISSVQLVLNALTPKAYALLRMVLGMFEHVVKNNRLNFSDDLPTTYFIVRCFTPIIFPSSDPSFMHLLRFMISNAGRLFQQVEEFQQIVELKIKAVGIVSAFSQRITKQEYDAQKDLLNDHMAILLNSIIADASMSIKDKRKKLKQFQKQYPDVYAARLANSTSEESIFAACSSKPKPRLTKFKSLRI